MKKEMFEKGKEITEEISMIETLIERITESSGIEIAFKDCTPTTEVPEPIHGWLIKTLLDKLIYEKECLEEQFRLL